MSINIGDKVTVQLVPGVYVDRVTKGYDGLTGIVTNVDTEARFDDEGDTNEFPVRVHFEGIENSEYFRVNELVPVSA